MTGPMEAKSEKVGAVAAELLPCPFCGDEAFVFANSSGLIGEDWPRGRCYNCHSMGPIADHINDRAEAITAWNTRAPVAAQADLLEAAKEGLLAVEAGIETRETQLSEWGSNPEVDGAWRVFSARAKKIRAAIAKAKGQRP